MSYVNVLLVCLQGVWRKGRFFSEYPGDNGVYLSHLSSIVELVQRMASSVVVFSGGPTQARAPGVSEAKSAKDYLEQKDALPCHASNLILDEAALDTSQNLIMGLAAMRLAIGWQRPIGEIVISVCWGPKRRRLARLAGLLGISDRVHVIPHDWEGRCAFNSDALREGESKFVEESRDDVLLLAPAWEQKRRERWHGHGSYDSRLDPFLHHERVRPWFQLVNSASHTNDIPQGQLREAFNGLVGPLT